MKLKWNKEMLQAFHEITKLDRIFETISKEVGFPENRVVNEGFKSLTKIIIGQQISTNVADKIYNKLLKDNLLNEKCLCEITLERLKTYGLSSAKAHYIKNLAILVINNELNLKTLRFLSSKDITDLLIKVKGIGKWTINNYKIFALQDADAWPNADLALQEALKMLKNLDTRPNQYEMETLGMAWKPYRGAAALYLWHFYNKVKIEKRIFNYDKY